MWGSWDEIKSACIVESKKATYISFSFQSLEKLKDISCLYSSFHPAIKTSLENEGEAQSRSKHVLYVEKKRNVS